MDTRRDSEKNVTGPGYTNSKCQNQDLQAGSDGRAEILSESSWESKEKEALKESPWAFFKHN